jgi:uncharacterized membrane protein
VGFLITKIKNSCQENSLGLFIVVFSPILVLLGSLPQFELEGNENGC